MTKNFGIVISFIGLLFTQLTSAAIISASSTEIDYSYEFEFRSIAPVSVEDLDAEEREGLAHEIAENHANHLFGIFHAPEYAANYGVDQLLNEGFAGTKYPTVKIAEFVKKPKEKYLWVKYEVTGQMLVINEVVAGWMGNKLSAEIELPLLVDFPQIYKPISEESKLYGYIDGDSEFKKKKWKKCTDPDYYTAIDFSYFYNPYRSKCTELSQWPLAKLAKIKLTRDKKVQVKRKVPVRQMRSDNGNGRLVTLYFATGFDDYLSSENTDEEVLADEGYKQYLKTQELFRSKGFTKMESLAQFREKLSEDFENIELLTPVNMDNLPQRRFFSTFVKEEKNVTWVIRFAVFDADMVMDREYLIKSFPKFWKEAWENGDFVYFGGHARDGRAMDVYNHMLILEESGENAIEFDLNKNQIAFFDACSSYAHQQEQYSEVKPRGLHLMTYGVVSLYHLATTGISNLMDTFMAPSSEAPDWSELLLKMEESQLAGHTQFMYGEGEETEQYIEEWRELGQRPKYMLNVWVP